MTQGLLMREQDLLLVPMGAKELLLNLTWHNDLSLYHGITILQQRHSDVTPSCSLQNCTTSTPEGYEAAEAMVHYGQCRQLTLNRRSETPSPASMMQS